MNPSLKKDYFSLIWTYNMCTEKPLFIFYDKDKNCIYFYETKKEGDDFVYFSSEEEYSTFVHANIDAKVLNKKNKILYLNGYSQHLLSHFYLFFNQHPEHQLELLKDFKFLTRSDDIFYFFNYLNDDELLPALKSASSWVDFYHYDDILNKFKDYLINQNFDQHFQEQFFIDFISGHQKQINKKPVLSVHIEEFLIDNYPQIIPEVGEFIHAIKSRQSTLNTHYFQLAFKEYTASMNTHIDLDHLLNQLHVPKWGHLKYKEFIETYHQYLVKKNPTWKTFIVLAKNNKSMDVSILFNEGEFNLTTYQQHLLFGLLFCRQESKNKVTLNEMENIMFQCDLEHALPMKTNGQKPKI